MGTAVATADCTLDASSSSVSGSGSTLNVTIALTFQADKAVTVYFSTANGTALGGLDYAEASEASATTDSLSLFVVDTHDVLGKTITVAG